MLRSICPQKREIPSSQWELLTGTPPQIQLGISEEPQQLRLHNPIWLLSASTVVKHYNMLFISSSVREYVHKLTVLSILYLWSCDFGIICVKYHF